MCIRIVNNLIVSVIIIFPILGSNGTIHLHWNSLNLNLDVDSIMYAYIVTLYSISCPLPYAENYVKQSTEEVEGLQWDGGDHFRVSSSRQMCYDDAFSLMMVCR